MPRHRNDTRLVFETLEKRTMLAGDVAAQIVDGNLIVTGDDFDNDIIRLQSTSRAYLFSQNHLLLSSKRGVIGQNRISA